MVRIILIRHGETNWNIQGRYQGQEDTRLSERGFAQAGMLAQGLKDVHIDAAFSSPLKRSLLTCRACADLACDIEARYPEEFKQWHTQPHLVQMPGGENLEDVRKRARAAFDEFAQKYDGKTLKIWRTYVNAPAPHLTNLRKNTTAKRCLFPRMTLLTKPSSAMCWGWI